MRTGDLVADPDIDDVQKRMDGALEALRREFQGLRTGRASVSLLEPITVEAYGAKMPIAQVGTLGVPEPRMITVQVWDKAVVAATERAIREANLGLNPMRDGQLLRIPIPELSEDRRRELSKIAARYGEQARVAIRNVRRDGMDMLKRMEREGELSQDEQKVWAEEIQELTDQHIKAVDDALAAKEKEIMQV
ncbi:ribosome recycling factor [Constrictibacter sp. MBR-5]|jgi:ribosome recycling factor|uniref:ribosome recycling factor n=1 Tax=Constrictibacter sp. MBR-5 TaxID=3156467 RepID=UPI0033953D74